MDLVALETRLLGEEVPIQRYESECCKVDLLGRARIHFCVRWNLTRMFCVINYFHVLFLSTVFFFSSCFSMSFLSLCFHFFFEWLLGCFCPSSVYMFCSFRVVFFSSYLFVFVCCFLMLPLFVVSLLWAAALSLCQGPGRRQNAIFKICGFNAWTFCSTSASSTTDVAAIEAVPLNYQPTITTVIVPVLTPVGTLMLPRTCVRQDVVKRKFQRTPRKMRYYCIAGG